MSSPNYPLIAEVLQAIRNHPERHNQESWVALKTPEGKKREEFALNHLTIKGEELIVAEGSCQTSACIAGWALLYEGFEASDPFPNGMADNISYMRMTSPEGEGFPSYEVATIAAHVLGIPQDQNADQLFMDMEEDRAVAQLMYFYDNGRLPELEVYEGEFLLEDFDPSNDMDISWCRFEFDGVASDEFVSAQKKRFEELFPYSPQEEKTNA